MNWFYDLNEKYYKVTLQLSWIQDHKENWDNVWASIIHLSSILLPLYFAEIDFPGVTNQKGIQRCKDINTQFTKHGPVRNPKKSLQEIISCPNNLVKTSNMQRKILNRLIRFIKEDHCNGNTLSIMHS